MIHCSLATRGGGIGKLVSDWVALLHREKLNLLVLFFVNGTDDAACDVLYFGFKDKKDWILLSTWC